MKKDKFEDIKGIIRSGKSNDKLLVYNVQKNKDKHKQCPKEQRQT